MVSVGVSRFDCGAVLPTRRKMRLQLERVDQQWYAQAAGTMMLRIRDHVARHAAEGLIGRTEELAVLLQCLEPGGPRVVHLHGVAGVGKSTLLEAFVAEAR